MTDIAQREVETECKICLFPLSNCICPECPQCGIKGKVDCYKSHPLKLNQEQLIQRVEARITMLADNLDIERNYLEWLHEQGERYCEDWSEI